MTKHSVLLFLYLKLTLYLWSAFAKMSTAQLKLKLTYNLVNTCNVAVPRMIYYKKGQMDTYRQCSDVEYLSLSWRRGVLNVCFIFSSNNGMEITLLRCNNPFVCLFVLVKSHHELVRNLKLYQVSCSE